MNTTFILTVPAVPENIGAAARAIKTMGFSSLYLINPCNYLSNEARWLAHGSTDVLENAIVFNSFEDCIKEFDFIIGTSAKFRSSKYDYYSLENLNDIILNKQNSIKNLAIIFGKEESGLSNDQIKKCDVVSNIPMVNLYPSLNLGQAVMLYAYNLSKLKKTTLNSGNSASNTTAYSVLKSNVKKVLDSTSIIKNENLYYRILERVAVVKKDDINLLNSVCNAILKEVRGEK